jgi:hypothetical protein
MTIIRGDFGELAIETEQVDVTSALPRPDRTWQYTDRQGHEHRWERTLVSDYPTLTEVVDEKYWCDDCDDWHREFHMECATCGEHVEPRMVGQGAARELVPGRTSYRLNGDPISRERGQQIIFGAAQNGGAAPADPPIVERQIP